MLGPNFSPIVVEVLFNVSTVWRKLHCTHVTNETFQGITAFLVQIFFAFRIWRCKDCHCDAAIIRANVCTLAVSHQKIVLIVPVVRNLLSGRLVVSELYVVFR
jgi:hypothetical protein